MYSHIEGSTDFSFQTQFCNFFEFSLKNQYLPHLSSENCEINSIKSHSFHTIGPNSLKCIPTTHCQDKPQNNKSGGRESPGACNFVSRKLQCCNSMSLWIRLPWKTKNTCCKRAKCGHDNRRQHETQSSRGGFVPRAPTTHPFYTHLLLHLLRPPSVYLIPCLKKVSSCSQE